MPSPPSEQDLAEIRHAAFELRQTDPLEAIGVLRRLAKKGGDAEALVHGALGEILLEEFDDVDAALHHFRRLVTLAPELPAGHMGLARALSRQGDVKQAQNEYATAVTGLDKLVWEAINSSEDTVEGVEETVLTALELMVEERDLLTEGHKATPRTKPNEEIMRWAESTRLFDANLDLDDWMRFAQLRALIAALSGQIEEALAHVDRIADLVSLPTSYRYGLHSLAYEATRDIPKAAEVALHSITEEAGPEEMLRAASLLSRAERQSDARALLERLLSDLVGPDAKEIPREEREELLADAKALLETITPSALVQLGKKGGGGGS